MIFYYTVCTVAFIFCIVDSQEWDLWVKGYTESLILVDVVSLFSKKTLIEQSETVYFPYSPANKRCFLFLRGYQSNDV